MPPRSELIENSLWANSPYNPLLLAVEQAAREYEMPLPEDARERRRSEPLAYQGELLHSGVARYGTDFVFRVGAIVARMDGHPLVVGLGSSESLPQMLERWLRFDEQLTHDRRIEARLSSENVLEIAQCRADGTANSIVEDAVCLAIVVGFLEAFGMTGVRFEFSASGAGVGRRATIRWNDGGAPHSPGEPSWALPDESSRATFSTLVRTTNLSLARTSHLLGVSTRTLQRRLETVGTSFNDLVRLARITRAGRALLVPEVSVTEVALDAGFADGAHLSREFRSFVGVAPAGFRRVFT